MSIISSKNWMQAELLSIFSNNAKGMLVISVSGDGIHLSLSCGGMPGWNGMMAFIQLSLSFNSFEKRRRVEKRTFVTGGKIV